MGSASLREWTVGADGRPRILDERADGTVHEVRYRARSDAAKLGVTADARRRPG